MYLKLYIKHCRANKSLSYILDLGDKKADVRCCRRLHSYVVYLSAGQPSRPGTTRYIVHSKYVQNDSPRILPETHKCRLYFLFPRDNVCTLCIATVTIDMVNTVKVYIFVTVVNQSNNVGNTRLHVSRAAYKRKQVHCIGFYKIRHKKNLLSCTRNSFTE